MVGRNRALVKFRLAGKELWQRLDPLRVGPSNRFGIVRCAPSWSLRYAEGSALARRPNATTVTFLRHAE